MLQDIRGCTFEPHDRGPLRLVSLVPSTTETLFALGRGDDLVGYTRFCVHPKDRIRREKWIGGTKNPKIAKIIALQPDLVLANREENRKEDITALEEAGIPVWVPEPRTVRAAIADLRALSRLVGRAEEGARIARQMEQALSEAQSHAISRSVAYLIWRKPWMVAGEETFVSDMLKQGGAKNAFAGRYPQVLLHDLRAVERILLSSEPFPFAQKHRNELIAAGFRPEQLRLVDGERLSWHGVRLLEGLPYLRQVL